MPSMNANKRVTFLNTTITYSQPTSISKVEKNKAFYNKMDFRDIETEAFKDILKSQLGKFTCDVDYCLRGLEKFGRTNEGKQCRIQRQEFVRAILKEQTQNDGANGEVNLSIVSMKLSYENKVQAREQGILDENHAKIIHPVPFNHQNKMVETKRSTARAA
jgi:hypothetical protein